MNKYLTIQEATQLLTLGFEILPIDKVTGKLMSVKIFRNDPSPVNEPEAFKELTEKRNNLIEAHLKRNLHTNPEVNSEGVESSLLTLKKWQDALDEGIGITNS